MQIEIDDFIGESQRDMLLWAIEHEKHVLVTGPRGAGKTRLASWAAQRLNRHLEICHLGSAVDPESVLQGTTRLEGGKTIFTRARFVEAVTIPGAIVVLDEVNRLGDGSKGQGMLMSAMDYQRRLYLDQDAPGRQIVELGKGAVIIATANIGPAYCGTEALDLAWLDRAVKIRIEFSDRESEILRACGLGDRQIRRVMRIVAEIRKQYECGSLSDTISSRGLEVVGSMLADGIEIFAAFKATLSYWDNESDVALRTLVEVTR